MKPAQKLKGARLEAGQTQERDDASLLAHRTMLFFFGAMSMLGPYVTFGLSNMASFQKFNLPELSAFLPGLLCAVAGMAVGAAVRAAKRKRAKR